MPEEVLAAAQQYKDHAMAGEVKRGGIDFTVNKTPLEVKTDDKEEIKFNIDHAMLQQMENASGLKPVIVDIQPLQDLRVFLVS